MYPIGFNVTIKKGLALAIVIIGRRFMSQNLFLDGLPKAQTNELSKAIEASIRRARGVPASMANAAPQPQSALEVLRIRFARGEITKEQFEDMKRTLE